MTKNSTEHTALYELLSGLGLTRNDSSVYMELLRRGTPSSGSKVAARLDLHRQYVHNSLQKLLALNLIETVPVSGKRKLYKAYPPSYLENLAKQQLIQAQRAVRELNQISTIGAEQDF